MQYKPTSTLLFHHSNELNPSIAPASEKRPVFYWFNDSYHSHIPGKTPAYKYLYFFIIKPGGKVQLFTRHGTGDFASLWKDYSKYLRSREEDRKNSISRYLEPAIVMSFNELVPAVIGRLSDDFTLTVIKPDARDLSFSLREHGQFRNFGEIPELVGLCPEINTSVPVIHPDSNNLHNPESFWSADTVNEGRSWL